MGLEVVAIELEEVGEEGLFEGGHVVQAEH